MNRIVVLGCAGVGKTTSSRWLGEVVGAPVVCLDSIWQPNWGKENVPEFRRLIEESHSGLEWISDGNFSVATFDLRLPRASLILWLERPKLVCAWNVFKRVFRPGEAHRLRDLPKVLAFIRRFDRVNRPLIEEQLRLHGPDVPVRHVNSDSELRALVETLPRRP